MSVKSQVLDLLRSKEWLSCEDFEREFPPRTEGHLSWSQRMRELREDGFRIDKRLKDGAKHTWEYHLEESRRQPFEDERTGQFQFCK